ncbi:MAG: hypothetical protein NVS4B2_30950 [Chloroflexota bacterium]
MPETGKSLTGKALTFLAYRGIHVKSLCDACVERVTRDFDSSLFFEMLGDVAGSGCRKPHTCSPV